ncbi:MAG: hypothetical protein ACI9U2_003627 [Bradymonadia bacterium]
MALDARPAHLCVHLAADAGDYYGRVTGERVCADRDPSHCHPDAQRFITLTEAGVRLPRLVD